MTPPGRELCTACPRDRWRCRLVACLGAGIRYSNVMANPRGLLPVIAKSALVVLLLGGSLRYLTAGMLALGDEPGWMHGINLVFHEAGHVLLAWASPVVHSLAGTLGQWLVPLALAVAFGVRNRDGFAAAVCGWWFGQSLVDAAPYINDARTMRLMLLGGTTGDEIEGHDWNFILEQLNLLSLDIHLARGVLLAGRIVMVASLLAAAGFALLQAARPAPRREDGEEAASP
jgi:hypothetical protein